MSRFLEAVARARQPADKPLWLWSRATAHRKTAKTMVAAIIKGSQACPKGLWHGFGIAAVV